MGLIFWNQVLNGADVGGRATDISQVGLSLVAAVNAHYGSQDPPFEVKARMARMARKCEEAEREILEFAKLMVETLDA